MRNTLKITLLLSCILSCDSHRWFQSVFAQNQTLKSSCATCSSVLVREKSSATPDCLRGLVPTSGARVFLTKDPAGLEREVLIDYPTNWNKTAAGSLTRRPFVLAFHGWGGTPEQLERTTRIAEETTARGWISARIRGVRKSFNAGTCCGDAIKRNVQDVEFARQVISSLAAEGCVDTQRVYATGFSNGGFLSHRLACEARNNFAAIASVAGTLGIDDCKPSRPIPILHIHGQADPIVKFDGTPKYGWSSVPATLEQWVQINQCNPSRSQEVYTKGAARCVRYEGCAQSSEVIFCRDEYAGHTWPGGPNSTGRGGSQDIDSTKYILDFFSKHTLSL